MLLAVSAKAIKYATRKQTAIGAGEPVYVLKTHGSALSPLNPNRK